MSIKLYIFGYRDQHFLEKYGPAVRDLMISQALAEDSGISEIVYFNRPLSVGEMLVRRKWRSSAEIPGVHFLQSFSFDLVAPLLLRRKWVQDAYSRYYENVKLDKAYKNVVLDFLPIGTLPSWTRQADFYWYDLIDNFTKHHRFSEKEKKCVEQKYEHVRQNADLVTGVSEAALDSFRDGLVLPNALLQQYTPMLPDKPYDFGFMGFVTDKFDIAAVEKLAEEGYTIAIHGESYDRNVTAKLSSIDNVTVYGGFHFNDAEAVMSNFKVGLVPYLKDKLHDESPLKMYQYLSARKNVLSSTSFGMSSPHLFVYERSNLLDVAKGSLSTPRMSVDQAHLYFEMNSWKHRIAEPLEILKRALM